MFISEKPETQSHRLMQLEIKLWTLLQVSADAKTERNVVMYRAYLAQRKFAVVLDEVNKSSPPELQAVRFFADYLASDSHRYVGLPLTHKLVMYMVLIWP